MPPSLGKGHRSLVVVAGFKVPVNLAVFAGTRLVREGGTVPIHQVAWQRIPVNQVARGEPDGHPRSESRPPPPPYRNHRRRRRRGCGGSGGPIHQVLAAQRPGAGCRCAGRGRRQSPRGRRARHGDVARPADLAGAPQRGTAGRARRRGVAPARSQFGEQRPAAGIRAQRAPLDPPGNPGPGRVLHPPGLHPDLPSRAAAAAVRRGLEGRVLLPVPQLPLRHGRPRVRRVPAPTNLAVPPYHFADDNRIVVGVDPEEAA